MDEKLNKELDIIIENKISDLWRNLPPEAKAGILTAGISAGIPAFIQGIRSFFKLFREKCKRRCQSLRGEKQYNICYYNCKKDGIKRCIRNLESVRTKCKDDKCRKKINQELTTWKDKLSELDQLIKKI